MSDLKQARPSVMAWVGWIAIALGGVVAVIFAINSALARHSGLSAVYDDVASRDTAVMWFGIGVALFGVVVVAIDRLAGRRR